MGETGYSISVNEPGIYTVDITRLGCTVTRTITVAGSENAHIESITVNDFITDYNTVIVNVSGTSPGDYVFALDNPAGPFAASTIFVDVAPGIHELYIKDLLACGTFGPIQVNVLGIPKYFTPNGDGFNDTWNIKGVNAAHHAKATVYIFDRYGKLLKQISPMGSGWDGNYLDRPAPADDYWYTIELEDLRKAKGHFTLKR
jgi:gliding motility-associated-like protein